MVEIKLSLKKIFEKLSLKPALSVFLVALFARMTVIIFSNLTKDGLLFEDDRGYFALGKMYAEGDPSFPLYEPFWNSVESFTWPIGFLFKVFTAQAFLAQILSALAGALVASTVTLLLKQHVNRKIALYAGLLAALYPSQVLWSSLILKDVFVWMALSAAVLISQWWFKQAKILNILTGVLGLLIITFYLSRLRVHTLIILCIALLISIVHKKNRHRSIKVLISTTLLVLLPLSAGSGIAGVDVVKILFGSDGQSQLVQIRHQGAEDASTALTETVRDEYGSIVTTQSLIEYQERVCYKEYENNQGNSSRNNEADEKLDECLSLVSFSSYGLVDDIMYLPVGVRVMIIDPLPSRLNGNTKVIMAFIEHIFWYPLLILSFIGIRKFWRKPDLLFASMLGMGIISKWALVEGNFGTAYRHRGEFVWIIIIFAAIGLEKYIEKRKQRSKESKQSNVL